MDANPQEIPADQRKLYEYWQTQFKRAAKKMPKKDWDRAKKRFTANGKRNEENDKPLIDFPVVNDLRNHIESSLSYLDQKAPSFKVSPAPAFEGSDMIRTEEGLVPNDDPTTNVVMRAKCDKAMLEYIWHEQQCQRVSSRRLDSALLRNVGCVLPVFDKKKWLPGLRYVPAEHVRIDPDCEGNFDEANWTAYYEYMSIEQIQAENKKLTEAEIELIRKDGISALDDEDREKASEEKEAMFSTAQVWHVYAKNDAAVRTFSKDKTEPDADQALLDELGISTPRRYLRFIMGLQRPVVNKDGWPFDLDHNENMVGTLTLNHVPEDDYGFTDYQQMELMDQMSDAMMQRILFDAELSTKKALGTPDGAEIDKNDIETLLDTKEISVHPGLVDEQGNPKFHEMIVHRPCTELPKYYELYHQASIDASADAELSLDSMADSPYKDVTALGVRADIERRHRRTNLRLGGPRGYEEAIADDARKLLQIAHQFIPRQSRLRVRQTEKVVEGNQEGVEKEVVKTVSMPWPQAQREMAQNGATLVNLGADAIVGPDLAAFWMTTEELPMAAIRLSTEIRVEPGSTRNLTQVQQVAELERFYVEVLYPTIYEPMGRFDLAVLFLQHIGDMASGIEQMERYLPSREEIAEFQKAQAEAQAQQMQIEAAKVQQGNLADQSKAEAEQQKAVLEEAKAEAEMQRDDESHAAEMEREVEKTELEIAKTRQEMALKSLQPQRTE